MAGPGRAWSRLDRDLGVEVAGMLLDDAVVPVIGLAGLEDLELAPVGASESLCGE